MHKPRSRRTARAMKLGALALYTFCLSILATVGLFAYSIVSDDRDMAVNSLGMVALSIILFILYRVFASSANCPLCRCPVLAGSGAQRNTRARRTLGSHRLRVARDIILTNSFVCPYCAEATECTVKPLPGGRSPSR